MKYVYENMSVIGMGTTGFWSRINQGLSQCIERAVNEYGMTLVDTAEMYGYGRCEERLGLVMRKCGRDHFYVVDKILPEHVSNRQFMSSLDASLRRLGTDHIDLYLLHWRGDFDLRLLCECMHQAKESGKILNWGVSNFDVEDMEELLTCRYGTECICDQVFYNVFERGIETRLMPWLKNRNMIPMAYSSLGSDYHPHPNLHNNRQLMRRCEYDHLAPEAVALRFLQDQGAVTLFSTASKAHLDANMHCLNIDMKEYRSLIDTDYPAPTESYPLVKI